MFSSLFAVAANSQYSSKSLLSEGRWVKIRVGKTGVFKLTYADLKGMGFDDPSKVSIHGYGGAPLDEDFSNDYIDDLPSTPVWRGSDYLLFYGRGPISWRYDEASSTFVHTNNPYSLYGYYFVTDATPVSDVKELDSVDGATVRLSTYDDYLLHEQDLVSVAKSGRELYGEDLSGAKPRTLSDLSSIPGITQDDAKVTMSFISKVSSGAGVASLSINGSKLMDISIQANNESHVKALEGKRTVVWSGDKSEKNSVVVSYNSAFHNNVRLNYVRLNVKRALRPYGAYTLFRSVASVNNVTRFLVSGADANTIVLDVTDPREVSLMKGSLDGSGFSFTIPAGGLREFALIRLDQRFDTPELVGEVPNQDLHSIQQSDMVIIAQKGLASEAERLAEVHRGDDGLSVHVVDPQAIYNEFSSGTPDATAYRRFMKMLYDRAGQGDGAPKYLLLFGDGAYDNRAICADVKGLPFDNMLLTYQSEESLSEFSARYGYSYVTDDYFGLLDDSSNKSLTARNSISLGIGRFPIRSLSEAKAMVDKVIGYMRDGELGAWKNQITFVADDGNNADGYTTKHAEQADALARFIDESHPEFRTNKVYFDAYKRDNSGGYPDVRKRIAELLKSGQLLLNYTGHGNTLAWSDEYVWTQSDIMQSTYSKLPVWVTATCDFTRFDDVGTSAGESVFLNTTSGGIALFTTTRPVDSYGNASLNQELYRNLFDNAGGRVTLGDAMMKTKRNLTGVNKLNFILIGDPAMPVSFPKYSARVTAVNGVEPDGEPVAFKALQKVTVEGEIVASDGALASDFSGTLEATVLDSQAKITTLGNNVVDGEPRRFSYTDYPNAIYIGQDSVRKGKFSFSFMVPKDISYSNEHGKMNLYASDSDSRREANGSFLDYIVGGTADVIDRDTVGPEVRQIYLNDSSFVDGGVVNTTPYFVARIWDKSGVNITGSSIGHDIVLTIDSMPSMSYNLNSRYALIPESDGEGLVQFSIPALTAGIHTAEFKVWDILNNSTTYIFTFEVSEGLKPNLIELHATPSPARERVEFYLAHNRPESMLDVTIMVYDMQGKLLWNGRKSGSSELFKSFVVSWDLRDNGGRRVRPGIYIYRAAISQNGSKEATDANKLIILAQ